MRRLAARMLVAAVATVALLTVAVAPSHAFFSSFEDLSFEEWTSWQRTDAGSMYAATAAGEGITAHHGSAVAAFEVTAGDHLTGDIHSKLYQTWAIDSPESGWVDDNNDPFQPLPRGSEGGTYSAWYYLPEGYEANGDWANIFQWKESYLDLSEDWHQDPQWWLNITQASDWPPLERPPGTSGSDPVLVANYWGNPWTGDPPLLAVPRGRWFEIRAELIPGDRIDWFVDGDFWQSSLDSTYPVGVSKAHPTGWTFGVGHYGGVGKLWVDSVRFDPVPTFPEVVESLPDPRLYLRLGEATGPFADSSGLGNDGTLAGTGATRGVSGLVADDDGALDLTPDSYVEVDADESLDVEDEVTIVAVIEPEEIVAGWQPILASGGYYVTISDEDLVASINDGFDWFEGVNSGGGAPPIAEDERALVVYTYDGQTHRLYANGALVGSYYEPGSIGAAGTVRIGDFFSDRYGGVVDEVFVGGEAIDASDVEALYDALDVEPS